MYIIFIREKKCVMFQRISNSANDMMEPLRYVGRLFVWFLLRLIWFATQFVNLPGIHAKVHNDEDAPDPPPPPTLYLHHYPCDQKRTLYMLNETIAAKGVTNHSDYCSRPFYAQRVNIYFRQLCKYLFSLTKTDYM